MELALPSELVTPAPPLMEVTLPPAVPPVLALQPVFPPINQGIPPVLAPAQVPATFTLPGDCIVAVPEQIIAVSVG